MKPSAPVLHTGDRPGLPGAPIATLFARSTRGGAGCRCRCSSHGTSFYGSKRAAAAFQSCYQCFQSCVYASANRRHSYVSAATGGAFPSVRARHSEPKGERYRAKGRDSGWRPQIVPPTVHQPARHRSGRHSDHPGPEKRRKTERHKGRNTEQAARDAKDGEKNRADALWPTSCARGGARKRGEIPSNKQRLSERCWRATRVPSSGIHDCNAGGGACSS